MNEYLELLRAEKSKTRHQETPSKPSKVTSEGFEGDHPRCFFDSSAIEALGDCPPAGVDHGRWLLARDDALAFVETWGEQAAALGWKAEDLFRLHPTAPLARRDVMGLVWLLCGRPVVAMTESTATIKSPTGSLLTYYRCTDEPMNAPC
jgi:hypothetical protein